MAVVEWELKPTSLPDDVALTIASFLDTGSDVCSLGSCSRFWRELCAADCLWRDLARSRWPRLALSVRHADNTSNHQGWRSFYITTHKRLSGCASIVIKSVEQWTNNDSLEVGNYLKAVSDLRSMDLGFKDVQLFLLAKKHSVLLNLIGLHYSIFCLGISPNDVTEALRACGVTERQVCVSWFKLGRWFYGFRLPDEHRSRKISLGELAMDKGEEVLGVLNRGVVHEVLRVHIKAANARTAQPSHSMGHLS
ncbi:uncharacterized protein M6B38_130580 [Iris pallida]|uniref:F-box domain-containing protein n=1 Tax=Iris pallida TaxID=29817 RepID=A0AAX6FZD8_IRIPA|nr:uncharacterized protein M6B38_130580 [Iris pallida]